MAKSPDLYTLCDVCKGEGMNKDSDPALFKWVNGYPVCIVCRGEKYLPLGLNKSQVDAMRARIVVLEDALRAVFPVITALMHKLFNASNNPPDETGYTQVSALHVQIKAALQGAQLRAERPEKIEAIPPHYLHRADSSDYEHLSNRPDMRKQDRAKYDDNEDGAR